MKDLDMPEPKVEPRAPVAGRFNTAQADALARPVDLIERTLLGVGSATFSLDMQHRLLLTRTLAGPRDVEPVSVLFVMLNPSTADEAKPDPTITRCMGFARSWGMHELRVCNLFTFRATKPADMKRATEKNHREANRFLIEQARTAAIVVCAWGVHGRIDFRDCEVTGLLHARRLQCLGKTDKTGAPRHPLYLPAATPLEAWP